VSRDINWSAAFKSLSSFSLTTTCCLLVRLVVGFLIGFFDFGGARRPVVVFFVVVGKVIGHKPIARHLCVPCMAAIDLLMHCTAVRLIVAPLGVEDNNVSSCFQYMASACRALCNRSNMGVVVEWAFVRRDSSLMTRLDSSCGSNDSTVVAV
jgi:hypothetical protein